MDSGGAGMSELLKLYRDAQKPYEKLIQYCATAPVGPAIYYDMLLDRYSEADQIFVKRALELEAENAALKEERRWKDSNVELPKEDTDGNALLVICRYSGEWARAPFGIEFSDEFVRHYSHWMNAPEMPEVQ
jgi:hypothetical protein